ncbi:hypothetical protein Ciccas_009002 [Cichlidogyrus casuarinus]|uniref:Uncharacterized protein n=1 Tax=Cichlidogyrus casuarinus TaxID=1844966 RepID=A0ABD2PZ79_9PLAT
MKLQNSGQITQNSFLCNGRKWERRRLLLFLLKTTAALLSAPRSTSHPPSLSCKLYNTHIHNIAAATVTTQVIIPSPTFWLQKHKIFHHPKIISKSTISAYFQNLCSPASATDSEEHP